MITSVVFKELFKETCKRPTDRIVLACQPDILFSLPADILGRFYLIIIVKDLEDKSRFISNLHRLSLLHLPLSICIPSKQSFSSISPNLDMVIAENLTEEIGLFIEQLVAQKATRNRQTLLLWSDKRIGKLIKAVEIASPSEVSKGWFISKMGLEGKDLQEDGLVREQDPFDDQDQIWEGAWDE
jgi:hypothetical protein